MVVDTVTTTLIPFAGSGVAGYCMGFVLRKVLKWVVIALGFLAGVFFIALQLMQKNGYINSVNWDKIGNDTSTQVQHWATNIDLSGAHGILNQLGIPVTSGLALGLIAGFVRTH